MFFAMNRFRVSPGSEAAFEEIWRSRDSHLQGVPGFVAFRMLKGEVTYDYALYVSHSTWENREVFTDWTKSDAFRSAHKGAGNHGAIYLEAPKLETFDTVEGI